MTELALQSQQNLVQIVGDKVATTSLKVAEVFEKQHKDVLKAIKNLRCTKDFMERNFAPFKINDLTGESISHYNISRDGMSFLVMGFTGSKAAHWKEQYINAFNAMEEKIKQGMPAPQSLPEALRLAADEAEKRMQAEAALEVAKPKAAALDRISAAEGSMCVTDAAKILQIRPKDLTIFLSTNGWMYKRPGCKDWLAYQSKIQSGYLEHNEYTYTDNQGYERIKTQVRLTAKGLTKVSELLEK